MSAGPATKMYAALTRVARETSTWPECAGYCKRAAAEAFENLTPTTLEAMDAAAEVASAVIRPDASATVSQGLLTLRLRVGRELHVEVVMLAAVEGAVLQALLQREIQRRKEEAKHA